MKNPSVEKHVVNWLKVSVATAICLFFAACGGDSSSNSGTGSENSGTGSDTPVSTDIHSEENDASSYTPEEIIPIKNKTITGLAQKGPFKSGSTVDIFELELDGKTFAQTGKSFMGKVSNDSGAFKIPNVSLKSQYALLRVTGYFSSEINGESVHATLTAVTDLSKRENVNVNILTHLEYDRVLYLLGKGMNFTAAKKQAEREVLAAFGIEGKFKNSEDLDVFGDSDADAALVAISKLLLAGKKENSNRDEEDLSGLLADIATDIEEDGEWKDHSGTNKNDIANRVKESCECSIGESCYDYSMIEKYMCHFRTSWRSHSRAGRYCMSNNNQSFSRNDFRIDKIWNIFYFCRDGVWYKASLDDANTYSWSAGKDGEIRKGEFCKEMNTNTCNDVYYKYDEEKGEWIEASETDIQLKVCTMKNVGEILKGCCRDEKYGYYDYENSYGDSLYLYCDESGWRAATDLEVDNQGPKGKDGEIKDGDRYYDEELGQWMKFSTSEYNREVSNNIGYACTKKKEGACEPIGRDVNEFICTDSICDGFSMMLCKDGEWNSDNDCEPEYSTWSAGKDGELRISEKSRSYFMYDAKDGWAPLSLAEIDVRCVSSLEGKLNDSKTHLCTNGIWTWNGNYESFKDPRDGKTYKAIQIGSQKWMAENLNFEYKVEGATYGNLCNTDGCKIFGRYYTWAAAMDSAGVYSSNGIGCGIGKKCSPTYPVRGICPEGWHLPDVDEWLVLERTIGRSSSAMQAKGYEEWNNATDFYGFSALPVGFYVYDVDNGGVFGNYQFDGEAFFWNSYDGSGGGFPYYFYLSPFGTKYTSDILQRFPQYEYKDFSFSVRCVKDAP